FQPEPGMSAADHPASGLIPVALLVCAAVAFPHLRAGAPAIPAISLGLLAFVIGSVEPVFYGPDEGLSGDDFPGLLAAAGGVALVVVGISTAWRSRRRDGSPAWGYLGA